jgi:phosphoribosylanthranilate isomerase
MIVKICGITRVEDAMLAVSLGATAIGFIFWPGSPRRIAPSDARAIADSLPQPVLKVGVFVDAATDDVLRAIGEAHLTAVQLHGNETPQSAGALKTRVIKAMSLEQVSDAALEEWRGFPILLDAHDPVRRGGTGRTIDWPHAAAVAARHDVILAGGLRPENVVDAITRVRPCGIDVSSGVEVSPGVKDQDKLRSLFVALRGSHVMHDV